MLPGASWAPSVDRGGGSIGLYYSNNTVFTSHFGKYSSTSEITYKSGAENT